MKKISEIKEKIYSLEYCIKNKFGSEQAIKDAELMKNTLLWVLKASSSDE